MSPTRWLAATHRVAIRKIIDITGNLGLTGGVDGRENGDGREGCRPPGRLTQPRLGAEIVLNPDYPSAVPFSMIHPPLEPDSWDRVRRLVDDIAVEGLRRPLTVIAYVEGTGWSVVPGGGVKRYYAIQALIASNAPGWGMDALVDIEVLDCVAV